MSSSSGLSRLKRAVRINKFGELAFVSCDYCFERSRICMIIASEGKCAECARRDRPCVSTSQAALDKARDDLSLEISSDEKARNALVAQLGELQARIERKKKVREQADSRAAEKMACLTREIEESGELFAAENLGKLELDLSWNGVVSPFTQSGVASETSTEVGGNSSSS